MKRSENSLESKRYIKAKRRVDQLKGFYKHLAVYFIINLFFIGSRIYKDIRYGDSVLEAFTDTGNYGFFKWWGLALIIHAIGTFGIPNLFSKDWEERKIKELMNK